jgi:nucleotide-binding universal stress UspA family protein
MDQIAGHPIRICLAVHGYEAEGWASETARVLGAWVVPTVRVLAVSSAPRASFTSLTPAARRLYNASRAQWQRDETERLDRVVLPLAAALRGADVVRVDAGRGDLADTIVSAARAWRADVLVVGPPHPGLGGRLWPGAVHRRVLHRSRCTVAVVRPPATTPVKSRSRMLAQPVPSAGWA